MTQNPKRTENNRKTQDLDTKNINYKSLIAQYYDRDPGLSDTRDQIATFAPEIEILSQLNDFQKQIDALVKTKRYDVQEIYMKPPKQLQRVLRVKVVRKSQKLYIYGQLYPKQQNCPKFTTFFKQIKLYAEGQNNLLQNWRKPTSHFSERQGLVFKVPVESKNICLHLQLQSNPNRFEVQENLSKVVNLKKATRIEVLEAFWKYVKDRKLQDVENKEIINADQNIRKAFKVEKITFASVNNRIRQLLVPLEAVKLQINTERHVFDILVKVDERPNFDIVPFFSQKLNEEKNDHPFLSLSSKIKKYEKKVQEDTEKLRRHLAKRQLYRKFSPKELESLLREQYQLLKILKKGVASEDYNKLEYLLANQEEVEKEIKHYLDQVNIDRNIPHE